MQSTCSLSLSKQFHLELISLDHTRRRRSSSPSHGTDFFKLIAVVSDTAAGAAHRERGSDNAGEADFFMYLPRFLHAVGEPGTRRFEPNPTHRNVKFFAVFGFINGLLCGADHLHAKLFQDTLGGEQTSVFILREGVFYGQCSEICGVGHANMPIVVESVSVDKYIA